MIIYDYSPKHTRIKPHFEPVQTHSVSPFIQINDFNKKLMISSAILSSLLANM